MNNRVGTLHLPAGGASTTLLQDDEEEVPFEWTEEADKAFQDLKKYLTSHPVMVAPRPQEPLVLYLAATPYSASAALVAVREERWVKTVSLATPAKAEQGQESLTKTTTAAEKDQPQQGSAPGAEEASPSDQALGAPSSPEALQPPEDAS